jgi:hypothetical protein
VDISAGWRRGKAAKELGFVFNVIHNRLVKKIAGRKGKHGLEKD